MILAALALVAFQDRPVPPLTELEAGAAFAQVRAAAAADSGRLWGRSLAGPVLIVDPATRVSYASERDRAGSFAPAGAYWRTLLPKEVNPANTAITLGGRSWTMVLWPLPADSFARRQLLVHELWHRVQDSLGFPPRDPPNGHLDGAPGRTWLRLEARALARALESAGAARELAVVDALSFRAARERGQPGAEPAEAALERHEGLAEYTGLRLSGRPTAAQRAVAARAVLRLEEQETVARSFAYATGPAYGLLLDELRPGWRLELKSGVSLARLAARATGVTYHTGSALAEAETRYDGAAVRAAEAARAERRAARHRELSERFATGPTLRLPLGRAQIGFDPGKVEVLDSLGTVYGSLRLVDEWGILDATAGAGRVGAGWQSAWVPVGPDFDPRNPSGPGWKLELKPGWRIVAEEGGRWRVARGPES